MPPRVFISHTTRDPRDAALAGHIYRRLNEVGAEAWIAPHSIPAGDEWEPGLVNEILDRAGHFLVITSAAAAQSKWVQKEVALAKARYEANDPLRILRILPLHIGDPEDLPDATFLRRFQDIPYRPDLERQLLEVVKAVGEELSPWVPQLAFVREKTRHFVGRTFAFEFFDRFFSTQPCGHVIVEGVPGVGKSSLLAEAARRWNAPAYFNIQAQGYSRPEPFVQSLHTQLGFRFGLDLELPTGAVRDGWHVERLLDAVRLPPGERLVIVIDALDEVESGAGTAGTNPLFLPTTLPAGVFLLVSRRSHTAPLQIDGEWEVLDLMGRPAENRVDAESFIRTALARPELQKEFAAAEVGDLESWIAAVLDRSEGNFMYLLYLIRDVEQGRFLKSDLGDPPRGLHQYYERHWRRMMQASGPEARLRFRTVYALAQVRKPVTASLLAAILRVEPLDVLPLLDGWAQFLEIHKLDGACVYSLYHKDFCDFLMQKETVRAAGIDLGEITRDVGRGLLDGLDLAP